MFFYQRNWSPFLFISRSSSFPVVEVNVEIKFSGKKNSLSPDGHVTYPKKAGCLKCEISHLSYIIIPPSRPPFPGLTPVSLPPPPGSVRLEFGRTLTSQPNFLGWIEYQIFLSMGLRSRVEFRCKCMQA